MWRSYFTLRVIPSSFTKLDLSLLETRRNGLLACKTYGRFATLIETIRMPAPLLTTREHAPMRLAFPPPCAADSVLFAPRAFAITLRRMTILLGLTFHQVPIFAIPHSVKTPVIRGATGLATITLVASLHQGTSPKWFATRVSSALQVATGVSSCTRCKSTSSQYRCLSPAVLTSSPNVRLTDWKTAC